MDVLRQPTPTIDEGGDGFRVEPSKVIDLIISKQTQYYTLWAVYSAVQLAVGSYGSTQPSTRTASLAVLVGVWMFNLGHLSFVLRCVEQLDKWGSALTAALNGELGRYRAELRSAVGQMPAGGFFWPSRERKGMLHSYLLNTAVHLGIDVCASVALLTR